MGDEIKESKPVHIAVLGLGYVGSVTAACLAKLGHQVVGVDRDIFKVECILEAKAPFYEPGLEELIAEGRAAGRLSAVTSVGDVLAETDVILLCVGTPSERSGNISVEQLRRACAEIARGLKGRTRPLVVAVRSTSFPGTCEEVVAASLGHEAVVRVVCNPEFLREGTAVRDFLEPSLLVVGGTDQQAVKLVAGLYAGLDVEACLVELRTAELIKYACNAFHAVKISFANEIGALAGNLGISGEQVMETLCRDIRLNISPAYLKPGFAFGGSCLPKDLRALVFRASRQDLKLPMLENVLPSNDEHLRRAIDTALALPGAKLGFFGLSFKENTDDLRESPVVTLLEQLAGKGREIRVFDPHIRLDQIYGTNLNFLLTALPHIGKMMVPRLEELLAWSDQLIVTQKPPADSAVQLNKSGKVALELWRAWQPQRG